jgi:hypothetical protein
MHKCVVQSSTSDVVEEDRENDQFSCDWYRRRRPSPTGSDLPTSGTRGDISWVWPFGFWIVKREERRRPDGRRLRSAKRAESQCADDWLVDFDALRSLKTLKSGAKTTVGANSTQYSTVLYLYRNGIVRD